MTEGKVKEHFYSRHHTKTFYIDPLMKIAAMIYSVNHPSSILSLLFDEGTLNKTSSVLLLLFLHKK
jgi:hypothetical protein